MKLLHKSDVPNGWVLRIIPWKSLNENQKLLFHILRVDDINFSLKKITENSNFQSFFVLNDRFVSRAWNHCINNCMFGMLGVWNAWYFALFVVNWLYIGWLFENNSTQPPPTEFMGATYSCSQGPFASWTHFANTILKKYHSQHRYSHETKFNCYCQCYTSITFLFVMVQNHKLRRTERNCFKILTFQCWSSLWNYNHTFCGSFLCLKCVTCASPL